MQRDLFGETRNEPIGLVVQLPDTCYCGAIRATIGAGTGPHIASLRCVNCNKHRGWLSHQTFHFLTETIRLHGRPTRPIVIRRGVVTPYLGLNEW